MRSCVMFLAAIEHFEHVHMHVAARPSSALRGTKVFDLLKRPAEEWVPDDEMYAFAVRITARLDDELAR
jgi:hypothetical protein